MQVILLENIARLGNVGALVDVKTGYGRNYLLPRGKAMRASKENVAQFEARRDQLEKQNELARQQAQTKAQKLNGVSVTIMRQSSEGGNLYGSVAARDVSDALTKAGHEVERQSINLPGAIKTLGEHTAVIQLYGDVTAEITVIVVRNVEGNQAA